MKVIVRLTNHRVPPYVLTGVSEADAAALVEEWRWGVARVITLSVAETTVHLARREILSVEVDPEETE